MDVTATINIEDAELAELSRILNCPENEVQENLTSHASAALKEYVGMYLGQKAFKRGSDILEHRLYLLIRTAFADSLPDESQVCRLFQITASESRSLLRSVMSKYQYQLHDAVENSLRRALDSAQQPADVDPFLVTINNANIVEALNRALADIDGTLSRVSKQRGSVSTYEIEPASYNRLREKFPPQPGETA